MTDKIAVPLSGNPSVVVLDNGERLPRGRALQAGYRIVDAATLARLDDETTRANVLPAWRAHVSQLPEAQARPSAGAQLIEQQPLMSIDRVRAFLRGLPVETEETNTMEETMNTNHDPARAARLAELTVSVSSFNRDRGWTKPQAVAPKPTAAVSNAEPEKLKRLAEIEGSVTAFNRERHGTNGGAAARPALKQLAQNRLDNLTTAGKGRSEEAKSLRLALDAHNSTGAPLERTLMPLGISAAALIGTQTA